MNCYYSSYLGFISYDFSQERDKFTWYSNIDIMWWSSFLRNKRIRVSFGALFILFCELTQVIMKLHKKPLSVSLNTWHTYMSSFPGSKLQLAQPCEVGFCSHKLHRCEVQNGIAECICSTACTFEYAPVCASDNKTYPNKCAMEVAECEKGYRLRVVKSGQCGKVQILHCGFARILSLNYSKAFFLSPRWNQTARTLFHEKKMLFISAF